MLIGIKDLIALKAIVEVDKDRNLLAKELKDEIKVKFPQEIPPTVATIVKRISEARQQSINRLDKQWHLGVLNTLPDNMHFVSGDEIDAIFQTQHWFFEVREDNYFDGFTIGEKVKGIKPMSLLIDRFTIRQAKWVAALHCSVDNDLEFLWHASFHYSILEIISEITREGDFNTWEIDKDFRQGRKHYLRNLSRHFDGYRELFGDDFVKAINIFRNVDTNDGGN